MAQGRVGAHLDTPVSCKPDTPPTWYASHPAEHLVLCTGLLFVSLQSRSVTSAALVLGVVSAHALSSGVGVRRWLQLLAAPLVFVAMSIVPFALEPGTTAPRGGMALPLGWSSSGAADGLVVGTRALAASSCLLLFAVRTPLHVLALLLRRLNVPALLTDSLLLTARLVTITRARFEARQRAAVLRLGNASWTARWRTAGLLGATLLMDTLHQARRLEIGLEARGGFSTEGVVTPSWKHLSGATLFGGVLLATVLLLIVHRVDAFRG